jgi:hypothetical protein
VDDVITADSQPNQEITGANAVRPMAKPKGRAPRQMDKGKKRAPGVTKPPSPRR